MDKCFCSFGCESATDGPKLTELVEIPAGMTSDVCGEHELTVNEYS